MRPYKIYIAVGAAVFVIFICQFILEQFLNDELHDIHAFAKEVEYENLLKEVTSPVILWWASFGGRTPGEVRQCGHRSCFFTEDRRFQQHPLLKALMFYGSNLNWTDLPLPRGDISWSLLHEESPRNNRALGHAAAMSLFNHTATFSRHSSFPLTTQYLARLQDMTDMKHFKTTEEKKRLAMEMGLAPVIYMQSDCSTPTDRDSFVYELMKYIGVDSYGGCLHNKDLPESLRGPNYLDAMMGDELLEFTSRYMFVLALENGVCEDYITEKLWRPLIAGAVPIYIGSPSVSDWLPNRKSAVLGEEFYSPEKLAEHLHWLIKNDSEYESHLSHKLSGEITNDRLVREMERRGWSTEFENNFVHSFECFVCEKVHEKGVPSVANSRHYSCPVPASFLSKKPNASNYWLDNWFVGECEADFIRERAASGAARISQTEIDKWIVGNMETGKCIYDGVR